MNKLTMCRSYDPDCFYVQDKQACQDGCKHVVDGILYYAEYEGWCPYLVEPKVDADLATVEPPHE